MLKHLHRALLEYIRENLGIYMVITAFFVLGVILGSLVLKFMEESRLVELNHALSYFLEGIKKEHGNTLSPLELLKVSYQKNFLFWFVVWLFGMLWMGFPFILFFLVLKGFALGFTVGFLVKQLALKGVIFSFAAIIPHNLVLIPVYIVAATTATTFSLLKLKDRLGKKNVLRSYYFSKYCLLMFLLLIFILIGGLIEAYITSVFMRLAAGFI